MEVFICKIVPSNKTFKHHAHKTKVEFKAAKQNLKQKIETGIFRKIM
jgi:hypothetical protein